LLKFQILNFHRKFESQFVRHGLVSLAASSKYVGWLRQIKFRPDSIESIGGTT